MRRAVALMSLLLCWSLISPAAAQSRDGKPKPKFANRLAKETSPYLLMHAHNPTDWYPWGAEAFDKAKKEGKLVFLSIGYSSCYWCHVMERESFNNEDVAKILNQDFICIKVDREERPDIDNIYMTALNVLRQRGGWPLSMFLTPEGKPIVGGTYWPPDDRKAGNEIYAGFKSVLKIVHKEWKDNRKDIADQADRLADATVALLERPLLGLAIVDLDRKLVDSVVDALKDEYDEDYGGFGSQRGPKFPVPPRLLFLLQVGARAKAAELVDMVSFTLDKMARGGIYDQLGGGFHRYSTERTWTVPHFEKMLYDNAQLVEVYARAWRQTKNPQCRRIVQETLAYVAREMTSPEGAFYSSQDAETHHEEGRSYVWTDAELAAALADKSDLDFARKVYGVGVKPNFEGKFHILTLPKPLPDVAKELSLSKEELQKRLAAVKEQLLKARDKRDQPFRNEIALTAWSGQMIAGFAEAGMALEEKSYIDAAAKAASFILHKQRTPDGRLLRTYGAAPGQKSRAAVSAYIEDYAFFVHGLLCLHDATHDNKWLDEAKALTDLMIEHYGDKRSGGYYFTARDAEKLFARSKDQHDGAQPAGNSVAARNLVRLWAKTGDDRYRAEAERLFRTFAGALKSQPAGLCTLAQALDLYLEVKDAQERKGK